jgi:PAS domain S-box-containing protein
MRTGRLQRAFLAIAVGAGAGWILRSALPSGSASLTVLAGILAIAGILAFAFGKRRIALEEYPQGTAGEDAVSHPPGGDREGRNTAIGAAASDTLGWNESCLSQLAENSLDLLASLTVEGTILYVSPASGRLLGFSPEELTGRPALGFVHPLDRRKVIEATAPENIRLSGIKIVCRLRHRDRSFHWFETECQYFSDLQARRTRIAVAARDITERVKADQYRAATHEVAAIRASGISSESSLPLFLTAICEQLGWEVGEAWLVDGSASILRRRATWHIPSPTLAAFVRDSAEVVFAPGVGLPGLAWSRGTAMWLTADSRVYRSEYFTRACLRGGLAFPLRDGERIHGVMSFLSRSVLPADLGLLDLVEGLGRQIGEFISRMRAEESLKADTERLGELVEDKTARLVALQDEVTRQHRLEQEVLLAAEVQRNLLPRTLPALDGYEIGAIALPARYVSGDFYDIVLPGPDSCDIFIADISGKGVPAAMMNSAARALLRRESLRRKPPAAMLVTLNEALYSDLDLSDMFLTALMARLETGRNAVTYASAGHTETIHFHAVSRRCERLPATSIPIGIARTMEIGETTFSLRPGDFLVFYSDGVTEATSPGGELFGMERFEALLAHCREETAEAIAAAVAVEVRNFSSGLPLSDDLTVLVLKARPRILHYRPRAELRALDPVLDAVRAVLAAYGGETAYAVELALSEVATNIVTHAFEGRTEGPETARPSFDIVLRLEPDRIVLDLFDKGSPFDLGSLGREADADPLREGGRGLGIVRALVDEFSYVPRDSTSVEGANHWRLVRTAKEEAT